VWRERTVPIEIECDPTLIAEVESSVPGCASAVEASAAISEVIKTSAVGWVTMHVDADVIRMDPFGGIGTARPG